ncbi:DUF4124 domain-containing protein [Pseudogulbenkiania sp. MAI-1]|uniref:DUF4124 domain-containing protein n=1 Tax=Pseudogulbenkiania sp. MAI-1 TaxID=990370 RepID=UPI00045EC4FD|nr:DUF4124 domain-containing protein [Pseudogulbenkiania sp. MAI-1]
MKTMLFCLLLASSLAQAQTIYKYVDPSGHVTFSNTPMKGGAPIKLSPLSTYSSSDEVKPSSSAPSSSPSTPPFSSRYPNVDSATQQQRDNGRRKILEQELANEQKALTEAQKALAEGRATRLGNERNYQKYLDRVQQLQEQVTEHQKNVEALRRELGQAASNAPK